MRFRIALLGAAAVAMLGAAQADARSCSSFAVIESYDPATSTIEVDYQRGSVNKFFPKPEGAPRDSSKIPGSCRGNITKDPTLAVKGTGGRLSITQIRTNFEGKMLNDPDDEAWLPAKLQELIKDKTEVVLVIRPGMKRDEAPDVTTVYLPANEADLAEIKRLEDQAEDVE